MQYFGDMRVIPLMGGRRRGGFTLIELLVVIAIISVLIGILLPVLSAARIRGRRSVCEANLRQLSVAMRSYLDSSGDVYPYASYMPSIDPFPIHDEENDEDEESEKAIIIADVLADHVGPDARVFACPADLGEIDRGLPHGTKPYYATEKSSYEYRWRLGGRTIKELLERRAEFFGRRTMENNFWIFRDIDNFHGPPDKPGARRYVYNDGHVTDFED